MNSALSNLFSLAGRILLAAMFVGAGYSKIGNFAGTAKYIASVGLPAPEVLAALTIALELGAGIALIIGFKARWAALALAVFTVAASVLFHKYWAMPADQKMVQMLMFMKNMAVTGGLLTVFAFGPGAWSVDRR